jgi:hypothetical protein
MTLYIGNTLKLEKAQSNEPKDISEYLQTKIGYHDDKTGRNYGMCISVLNKCQEYTYDRNGKYIANNQIISEYMQRAFRQIKTSQDRVLANYASSCLSDVSACLSQNNYAFGASTSTNYSDIAIRACLPIINTCRSVTLGLSEADVTTDSFADIYVWLDAGIGTEYQKKCVETGGTWSPKNTSTYDGSCTCPTGLRQSTDKKTCECTNGGTWSATTGTCVVESGN